MHYYYSEHGLSLFCERVLDSSCSLVPIVSCIFLLLEIDMAGTHMQKCPRSVKCLTRV